MCSNAYNDVTDFEISGIVCPPEKLKRRWKYGAGAGFLKKVRGGEGGRGEGGGLALFLFHCSKFIIFTFRNYFTLGKIFVMHLKKNNFFLPPQFYEKRSF